ncbi:MAG: ribonuclease T [Gammaproteobacteria bacterium]|nr:ribonuclease T [Gammaproteobacteria bacterium]
MVDRFRGYLPVVVDVETGGFNAKTDALLEIAAVLVTMDENGYLKRDRTVHANIEPFAGANIEEEALKFNGIDPKHPFRDAKSEQEALTEIFKPIRQSLKEQGCKRAILVGHNAFFDLSFLNAAVERTGIKRNPFHPFSTFDTVSLSGLAFGQTVLARAAVAAGMPWDHNEAHSAIYDTEQTAELFCKIVNLWKDCAPDLVQKINLPTTENL